MRILWITLESVLPLNTGGRIGVYKRLEQITKAAEVYLFYPFDKESELEYVEELKKHCKEVHPYSRKKNKLGSFMNLYKYPYTISSRVISDMEKDIKNCIEQNDIDIINVDFPHMCACLENICFNIPIVLNEHNIEWKVYKTIAKSHKKLIKKIAYFFDSYRLQYYEKRIFNKYIFSKVTFVSSEDMQYMIDNKYIDKDCAVLIPVGADEREIRNTKHDGINIVFVGKMSYGPNIEAVTWFAEEVIPRLLEDNRFLNMKFYIVGKDPTDEVKKLESKNVVVTGMVEDVAIYYDLADLVVLPLKNGGGVKIKLLEAISFRKPIVSTPVGVEGTYYANHFIPVAIEADRFAEYCRKILNGDYNYPEKKIYNYFIANYTWENIGKNYLNMFMEIMNEEY